MNFVVLTFVRGEYCKRSESSSYQKFKQKLKKSKHYLLEVLVESITLMTELRNPGYNSWRYEI